MRRACGWLLMLPLGAVACQPTSATVPAPETAAIEASPVRDEPLDGRFQAELDSAREKLGFPGATAAFVLPDGTVGVAASGLADVESAAPMTPQSRMLAASIGKSFVAATALALALDGVVDLDAPVSAVLSQRPWFSRLPNHDSLTLRQLLTHSAGLPDHVHSARFAKAVAQRWKEPGNPFPPETLIEFVLDEPALFPAGQGWAYSDTGYVLAGLVIEQASGQRYEQQLAARLLEPLGLSATTPSSRRSLPGLVAGYTAPDNPLGLPVKTTSAPGVMVWNPAVEWTGGGLVTSSRDLVLWARELYEGRALPGDYMDELLRAVLVGGEDSGVRYGAGVAIYEKTPFGPSYGHGGTIPGYVSSLRYYPQHRVAVAFQMNTDVDVDDAVPELERRLAEVAISASREVGPAEGD